MTSGITPPVENPKKLLHRLKSILSGRLGANTLLEYEASAVAVHSFSVLLCMLLKLVSSTSIINGAVTDGGSPPIKLVSVMIPNVISPGAIAGIPFRTFSAES